MKLLTPGTLETTTVFLIINDNFYNYDNFFLEFSREFRQKGAGFAQKALGYGQKAAGYGLKVKYFTCGGCQHFHSCARAREGRGGASFLKKIHESLVGLGNFV